MNKLSITLLTFILVNILLISAYLFIPQKFQSLDTQIRDFYFQVRGVQKASDSIIIIDIDEKSIKELGQWPWERNKLAQILNNLTDNNAGIIGLDIVFSEQDKSSPHHMIKEWNLKIDKLPNYDDILSKSIMNSPTILGYVFDFEEKIHENEAPHIPAIFIEKNKTDKNYIPQAKGVLTNLNIIQNAGYSSGYMNNIPDSNGIIRSVPLLIEYENTLYPSLALEMYRISQNISKITTHYSNTGVTKIQLGKQDISCDRFARMHINFRGPFKSYTYFSAVDIYNNIIKKKDIEGKFVLIGTSAYGLMDLRSTPMDSVIAGVEIHANIIDNLLNDDMLTQVNFIEFIDIFILVFLSFIIFFIYYRLHFLFLIFFFSLTFGAYFFSNYYLLFHYHLILNSFFPIIIMFISLLSVISINYIFEFRQKENIKNSFSKKVSAQVMEDLLSNIGTNDLSTKEVNATIYFSDIRNFTEISENFQSPKKTTEFLNFYMDNMVDSIEKHHGTIDKFIGDAIMAYWNAPLSMASHADKAVKSALEQINKRDFLNEIIFKKYNFTMDYGIGINTGDVIVGEIGSQGRSDYTIIGDSVNLAARVEGLCKIYKVRLIITQYTKKLLQEKFVVQFLDIVQVSGKKEAVRIYEVLSLGDITQEKQEELQLYNTAYKFYIDSHFKEALKIFEKLFSHYDKHLYLMYTQRCKELIEHTPESFNGIYIIDTK